LSEFVISGHVSHYLYFKLNPCQHDFTKSKSTIANFVTDRDSVIPLVGSQREAGGVHFDVGSTCDLPSYHASP
jgi:hypothetical protein